MNEIDINIRFKRKILIIYDQNIFDWGLYWNCVNMDIPLKVRIGYCIMMLDIYYELLENFMSQREGVHIPIEKKYQNLEKKERIHFNRIKYLEFYKLVTELQFIKFFRQEIVKLENELNEPHPRGMMSD